MCPGGLLDGSSGVYLAIMRPLAHIRAAANPGLGSGNKTLLNFHQTDASKLWCFFSNTNQAKLNATLTCQTIQNVSTPWNIHCHIKSNLLNRLLGKSYCLLVVVLAIKAEKQASMLSKIELQWNDDRAYEVFLSLLDVLLLDVTNESHLSNNHTWDNTICSPEWWPVCSGSTISTLGILG